MLRAFRETSSGGEAGGGEVDFLQHRVEGPRVAAEFVSGIGAEPADVATQVGGGHELVHLGG